MASEGPIYSTLRTRPTLAPLAREFAAALPALAAEIARHATSGKLELVRKLAHRLKGSAGGYGFPDIARTAADVEVAAGATDEARVAHGAEQLAALCDRALAGARADGEALSR